MCAFHSESDAQKHKQTLDEEVRKAEKQLKKCYECPLWQGGIDDLSFAEGYECGAKELHCYDDGKFYCDLVSDMQYDSYSSYSVAEVELH